jgi:hypothetical protein
MYFQLYSTAYLQTRLISDILFLVEFYEFRALRRSNTLSGVQTRIFSAGLDDCNESLTSGLAV